ncbi:hypothetical protein J6590_067557 [Homalodisca vitripennis]|nr:hypothetical protein J6590_067557 [Homalodisca vitripennis]
MPSDVRDGLFSRHTNGAETTVPAVTAPISHVVLMVRYKRCHVMAGTHTYTLH